MTTITTNIFALSATTTQSGQKAKQSDEAGGFDALLSLIDAEDKKDKNASAAGSPADFLGSIQQFIANIDATLFEIGSSNSSAGNAAAPTGLNADGTISVDALLNQGGPLPAYLDRLAQRYNLDEKQQQDLRNITIQFKDTTGSPAEVAAMGAALKQAGIG